MGLTITATAGELKEDYAVATVLAPAFLLADTDCIVWIGNAFVGGKHEEVSGITRCLEHIRENGATTPTGANESHAEVAFPCLKKDVNSAFNAAIDAVQTGTVTVTAGTAAVVGVATLFTTELKVGESIKIGTEILTVLTITDATNLVLAANHVAGAAGVAYSLVNVPEEGKVGIWYGPLFQATVGGSITTFVHRLTEAYLEQSQKAA